VSGQVDGGGILSRLLIFAMVALALSLGNDWLGMAAYAAHVVDGFFNILTTAL
jgi:hypothetical protein